MDKKEQQKTKKWEMAMATTLHQFTMFLKYLSSCLRWNRDIYHNNNPTRRKWGDIDGTEYEESNIEEQNFEEKILR